MPAGIEPTLEPTQLGETTGFKENCLFHCTIPFIVKELTKSPANVANANFGWLESFIKYYELDNSVTLEDIKNFFISHFPHPIDQEIILGPVLRFHLGEVLRKNKSRLAGEIFSHPSYGFNKLAESYLTAAENHCENATRSFTNFYTGNKEYLRNLRADYLNFCAENKLEARDTRNYQNFKNETAQSLTRYWSETGFDNYVTTIAGGSPTMLTPHDIRSLCENLKIEIITFEKISGAAGLETDYFYNEHESIKPRDATLSVKIINPSGVHWLYQEANVEAANMHNSYYQDNDLPKLANVRLQASANPDAAKELTKKHVQTYLPQATAAAGNADGKDSDVSDKSRDLVTQHLAFFKSLRQERPKIIPKDTALIESYNRHAEVFNLKTFLTYTDKDIENQLDSCRNAQEKFDYAMALQLQEEEVHKLFKLKK